MHIRNFIAGLFVTAGFLAVGSAHTYAQTPTDTTVAPANYTVRPGDYLAKIAAAYETTYTRLFDANTSIADPDVIHPGQTIRIPAANEQIPSRSIPANVPPVQPRAAAVSTKKIVSTKKAVSANPKPAASPTTGDVWAKLAACESSGNASTNTGNGYYGAYQFSARTWQGVGGSGLPSEASLEEQTARAQALQARSGWGQWPECSAKLGLR